MPSFIINSQQQRNGDHEVHNTTKGCSFMPLLSNQVVLGVHATCHGAVAHAKKKWPQPRINGCYYCCNECHTS